MLFSTNENALSLNTILLKNTEKDASCCLEVLETKLFTIQTSLPDEYCNDVVLQNKLLNAIYDVYACGLVYCKPAETVQSVISDLQGVPKKRLKIIIMFFYSAAVL